MRSKPIIDEIDEIKAKNRILTYEMTGKLHIESIGQNMGALGPKAS